MEYFFSQLSSHSSQFDTAYDLAAFCYDYLLDHIKLQPKFIGTYIWENPNSKCNNPNLPKLFRFSESIKTILCTQKEGYSYSSCQHKMFRQIELLQKQLASYCSPEHNDATIPFFILLAIDRYAQEVKTAHTAKAPLNQSYHAHSFIYLNSTDSMPDDRIEDNVIRDPYIRNQLKYLTILEDRDIPSEISDPPRIVPLYISEHDEVRRRCLDEKKIKIAVIPFSQEEMVSVCMDEGALFHIEYTSMHKESGRDRALMLLHRALEERANIIVFPEFICERAIQQALRNELKKLYKETPQKTSALLLVIAGSRWENNNNIADILAYNGRLLGCQYKQVPYSSIKPQNHLVENLRNPGKECTIIEVEHLGRIMFGICRDIVSESYLAKLTEIFLPQLLLVPAWSPSIKKGFVGPLERISARNHKTCSVLCNCCEAYKKLSAFKAETGIVMVPEKNNNIIRGKGEYLIRKRCSHTCKSVGCLFLIDLNLEEVSQGISIEWEQKILV